MLRRDDDIPLLLAKLKACQRVKITSRDFLNIHIEENTAAVPFYNAVLPVWEPTLDEVKSLTKCLKNSKTPG